MPTYEYQCESCKHEWEEEQRITDDCIEDCPECGEKKAKRLISGKISFQLLGGGWANEGYK